MAQDTKVAVGATQYDARVSHGMGGDVKGFTATVEIAAGADSNTSTYDFGYVPSDAKILGISRYSLDDASTESTATMDFGLFPVPGEDQFTGDDDALNDGIVLGTAAKDQPLIKDISDYGQRAWQFVNGLTAAPKGHMILRGTIKDANPSVGGTVTVECYFLLP
jgi:hypothetical protein